MSKAIVIFLLFSLAAYSAGCVTGGGPGTSDATVSPPLSSGSPDSVVSHFFTFLETGQSREAQELFLVRNPNQQSAVLTHVSRGVEFFTKASIRNSVVKTFVAGRFSLCAVEQTLSGSPGEYELEKGYLVLEDGHWRLLPQPQDHRAKLNELTAEEIAEFDLLTQKFTAFKSSYQGKP